MTIPERWSDAFRLAGLEANAHLVAAFEERWLDPGEILVRQGDVADSMFLVASGKLRVYLEEHADMTLRELNVGSIVGEVALLVGGERSASVRAVDRTCVLTLTRASFDEVVARSPEISVTFSQTLVQRLRRSSIARHLRSLFGDLDVEALEEIEKRATWVHLASGDDLFRVGDESDGAYIVVLGRLRIVVKTPIGEERVADEVGPGDLVGEMGLLIRKPRTATAYALRDTELVRISPEDFDDLAKRFPRLLRETSRVLVERLERQMTGERLARKGAHSFAIVPLSPNVDVRWFVRELEKEMSAIGSVCHLSAESVDAALGKPGIARSSTEDAAHLRLSAWLTGQESLHDFILYEADSRWSEWTDRATRSSDQIVFVGEGRASPELVESEMQISRRTKPGRAQRQSLILLQNSTKNAFPGTAKWLDRRNVDSHYHVRMGNRADVGRVSRILTGNAICLVMSGGGSRGYAHMGVIRAFEEIGIPIDVTSGASMGAIVAFAYAIGMDSETMLKKLPPLLRAAFFEPTLPVVSLMAGGQAMKRLGEIAGEFDIEDAILPTFAVSTNLTRGEQVIHRRGSMTIAARATGSVPGIFPPVPWKGDLLVDGGLTNNLPTDVMISLYGGKVIAVDVIPEVDLLAEGDLPNHVSGWAMVRKKMTPFAKPIGMPNILSVLMRSATTSSRGFRAKEEMMRECALYLRPSVSRWNIIDFSAARPIADEGHRNTVEALRAFWKKTKPAGSKSAEVARPRA